MSKFLNDLSKEKQTNQKIIKTLLSMSSKIQQIVEVKGKFKYYDFIVIKKNGEITKIESKTHYRALQTNNIAVEYMCSGKLSGISTTQADYQLHHIPGKCILLIKTATLLEACKNAYSVKGGDNYVANMYLLSIPTVIAIADKKIEVKY